LDIIIKCVLVRIDTHEAGEPQILDIIIKCVLVRIDTHEAGEPQILDIIIKCVLVRIDTHEAGEGVRPSTRRPHSECPPSLPL